jgi:hypothetical protein
LLVRGFKPTDSAAGVDAVETGEAGKMTEELSSRHVRGDQPLGAGDPDQMGLREVAGRVAGALVNLSADASLVIGLEGRWGSGKSSMLFLIEEELDRLRPARPHSVIHFRPWLIGNRDALLTTLFADLTTAIADMKASAGDTTKLTIARAKRASEATRNFANALSRAGGAIEVAGEAAAVGPLKWGGKGLKAAGDFFGHKPTAKSLDTLKARLVATLGDLEHRIIVTIDDVDRLEPAEIIEVLRLARSVADLPNVVYLLCYDSEILGRSIERAASVEDGNAFLEKIIQLTIPVPRPEIFQLRHWFEEELARFAVPKDDEGAARLKSVIDMEGGRRLTTPRAVNRALDSMRFLWPTLEEAGADLGDLVWLQLIKDANSKLYRWIEEYCATAAEISLGAARVDEEGRASLLKELLDATGDDYFDQIHYRYQFAEQLPGMDISYSKGEPPFTLLGQVPVQKRDQAIADKRLASPDHYRLYFALANPSHALTQADFDAFWLASRETPDAVARVLLALHEEKPVRSLGKADILLERIRATDPKQLKPLECANILLAFADCLDEACRLRAFSRHLVTDLWDRAERFLVPFLGRLDPGGRTGTIDAMFHDGRAIAWLTHLFRHDTFAQGRFGENTKPESEWYFTSPEFDRIREVMLARYQAMSFDDIFATIEPRNILYAWSQGGDPNGVRRLVEIASKDDAGFLRLLDSLQSTITTSEGSYKSLKPAYFEDLLDPTAARTRLEQMATGAPDAQRSIHARRLLDAFAIGNQF